MIDLCLHSGYKGRYDGAQSREGLNRTLEDLRQSDVFLGGVTLVMPGDFRKTSNYKEIDAGRRAQYVCQTVTFVPMLKS